MNVKRFSKVMITVAVVCGLAWAHNSIGEVAACYAAEDQNIVAIDFVPVGGQDIRSLEISPLYELGDNGAAVNVVRSSWFKNALCVLLNGMTCNYGNYLFMSNLVQMDIGTYNATGDFVYQSYENILLESPVSDERKADMNFSEVGCIE